MQKPIVFTNRKKCKLEENNIKADSIYNSDTKIKYLDINFNEKCGKSIRGKILKFLKNKYVRLNKLMYIPCYWV